MQATTEMIFDDLKNICPLSVTLTPEDDGFKMSVKGNVTHVRRVKLDAGTVHVEDMGYNYTGHSFDASDPTTAAHALNGLFHATVPGYEHGPVNA